jgi:Telomere length regulation protein
LILAFLQYYLILTVSDHENDPVGCSEHDIVLSCERLLKPSSAECQTFVIHYFVSQTPRVVDIRLCPLFLALLERCGILRSSLLDIAEEWSEWSFCQDVSTHKQHFVSVLLLEGLKKLKDEDLEDTLTMELLQGVTHRLESFVTEIRLDGMRIAQQVAQRVHQELHFEELEQAENEKMNQMRDLHTKIPLLDENEDNVDASMRTASKQKKSKRKPKPQDPDAEFNSDDDDDSGSVSNPGDDSSTIYDDELVPYNLDDDEEDLRETAKPLYLLRALELLRTGENDEHAHSNHDTALRALPELVRKRPDDLPDVAISLLLQVIRMEDKFGISDFLKLRQQSIVALCVMEPVVVGKQLTEEAFNEYPLSDRLTCFGALQQAAYELSGSMTLDQSAGALQTGPTPFMVENQNSADSATKTTLEIASSVRGPLLQSKTRRKRSPLVAPAIIKNNFTSIAPMWFYSIMGRFLKEKENEATWSGSNGSHFLASLLQTLAIIVEFAGLASAPVLARDLIEFSSSFLGADVAEVRMAVLIAVSTSFSVLPADRILAFLLASGDTLLRTITNLANADPDHKCRALASGLSQYFGEAAKQSRLQL